MKNIINAVAYFWFALLTFAILFGMPLTCELHPPENVWLHLAAFLLWLAWSTGIVAAIAYYSPDKGKK